MKTIFDILRLYIKNPIKEENGFSFNLNNLAISLDCSYLQSKILSDEWWFVFSRNRDKNIPVNKPNSIGSYDVLLVDGEIFDDVFIMDDNQLILTYGKFYPEYLSGDQTELYNTIVKKLDKN